MKDFKTMLDVIQLATSKCNMPTVLLKEYGINDLKAIAKEFNATLKPPTEILPFYRVSFYYGDLFVGVDGKKLKQVVTFEK